MRMTEKTERQAALRTLGHRPGVSVTMFVKGETKQTQEGGETQGDWIGGVSKPRRCIPGNETG